STSLNRNTSQHVLLKNNEKIVQCQLASIRKRIVSTEILDIEQYIRLSHPGSSLLNRSTSQHALLKNNEKVVQCQSTDIRKRNVSTKVLVTKQYVKLSQPDKHSLSLDQNIKIKVHEYYVHVQHLLIKIIKLKSMNTMQELTKH
ncbi:hypothetical protein RYX36_005650, partial [Vicia faba]